MYTCTKNKADFYQVKGKNIYQNDVILHKVESIYNRQPSCLRKSSREWRVSVCSDQAVKRKSLLNVYDFVMH